MIREEVRNNLITRAQDYFAHYLACLGSVCILICIEQWEEMKLPGDSTALLNDLFHVFEFDARMHLSSMHLELILRSKRLTALRACHLKSRLKLDVFILVDLHLLGMVLTVLLFSLFVLGQFTMLFKQFLRFEGK